jgi:hypothetical protein
VRVVAVAATPRTPAADANEPAPPPRDEKTHRALLKARGAVKELQAEVDGLEAALLDCAIDLSASAARARAEVGAEHREADHERMSLLLESQASVRRLQGEMAQLRENTATVATEHASGTQRLLVAQADELRASASAEAEQAVQMVRAAHRATDGQCERRSVCAFGGLTHPLWAVARGRCARRWRSGCTRRRRVRSGRRSICAPRTPPSPTAMRPSHRCETR